MTGTIQFPLSFEAAADSARSFNATMDKAAGSIEASARKASAEFDKMRKQILDASRGYTQFQEAASATFKGGATDKFQEDMRKAIAATGAAAKELSTLEKAYLKADEKVRNFNAALYQSKAAAEITYAKMTALSDALTGQAIAAAKASAQAQVLATKEAKTLSGINALIAARKRYNAATTGSSDLVTGLNAQAAKMEIVTNTTLKLATAQAKLDSESRLLSARMAELTTETAKNNLINKEQIASVERRLTYTAKLSAKLDELSMAAEKDNAKYLASIAVQKENNKELERSATFYTKLNHQVAQLTDMNNALTNGRAAEVLRLKEVNKGLEDASTYAARLANKYAELKRQEDSLKTGLAGNIAQLKVTNEYLEKQASYTAKLVAEKEYLRTVTDSLTTQLRLSNVATQTTISLEDKLAKINAELTYATGELTGALWKQAQANAATLAGMREESTFAERMKAKITELASSVEFLAGKEGRRYTSLSAQEKLQKRLNELLARSTAEYKALLAQVTALEAEERKLLGATSSLGVSFSSTQQSAASLRATLAGLGASFGSYTSSTLLVSVATFALVRGLKNVVSVGSEFEDAITRVAAISTKAAYSTEEYQSALSGLEARAVEVASSTRFMSGEVVQAMSEMAMAGMSAEEIIAGVSDVMNLAAIGAIGFGEAADISTNILMGFQLHISELGDVVDKMALAVTSSNQNISQLGNAMSYVAPIASAFGVSMDFVIASTEVLANAGIKASRAGTAMRRVLVSLFTPTTKGAKAMEQMGIEVNNIAEGFEDLEGLDAALGTNLLGDAAKGTEILTDRLKQLYIMTAGATQNIGLLNDIVGVRALPAFIQLIKSMDDGTKSLFELQLALQGAGGTAEETMRKMADTLKNDWLVFKGAIEAVQQTLFSLESDNLRRMVVEYTSSVQLLAKNKDYLASVVAAFKELGSTLWSVIKVLLAVKVAMTGWTILSVVYKGVQLLTANLALLTPSALKAAAAESAVAAASAQASAGLTGVTLSSRLAASGFALLVGGASGASAVLGALGTGALAAVTASLAYLGSLVTFLGKQLLTLMVRLVVPAVVLYLLWEVADYFFNIEESIFGVIDATSQMNNEFEASKAALDSEAASLIDGKLAKLYEELEVEKNQLIALEEKNRLYGDQADNIEEVKKRLTEVSSEINTAHETLKSYGNFTLFPQYQKDLANLSAAQRELEALEAKKKSLLKSEATRGVGGAAINSSVSAIDEQIASQKAAVDSLQELTDTSYARYEAAVGTTIDRLEALKLQYATVNSAMVEHKQKIDNVKASIEVLNNLKTTYSGNAAATSGLTIGLNNLSEAAIAASADMEALREDANLFSAAIKALDQTQPVTLESLKEAITSLQGSFDKLKSEAQSTSDELAAVQFSSSVSQMEALDSSIQQSIVAVASAYEELAASTNPNNFQGMKELQTLISSLSGKIQEFGKKGVETANKLQELEMKYDDTVKQTKELTASTTDLVTLYSNGKGDIDDFVSRLKKQLGETLKLDTATGNLTKTSEEAIAEYRRLISDLLTDQKTKLANLELDPSEKNKKSIDALRSSVTALSAALDLLNGDLTLLIGETKESKEQNRELKDVYSEQAEVLRLLDRNTQSLAKTRKGEIKTATESERAVLELKYALEDLNEIKEKALNWSDTTSELQEAFNTVKETLGIDFKSEYGNVFVEWYDPYPVVDATSKIKRTLYDSLSSIKGFGKSATEEITMQFDTLEERLKQVAAAAESAIRRLQALEVPQPSEDIPRQTGGSTSWYIPSSISDDEVVAVSAAIDNLSQEAKQGVAILNVLGKALEVNFDTKTVSEYVGELDKANTISEEMANIAGFSVPLDIPLTNELVNKLYEYRDAAKEIGENTIRFSAGTQELYANLKTNTVSVATDKLEGFGDSLDTISNSAPLAASATSSVSDEAASLSSSVSGANQNVLAFAENIKELKDSGSLEIKLGLTDAEFSGELSSQMLELKSKILDTVDSIIKLKTALNEASTKEDRIPILTQLEELTPRLVKYTEQYNAAKEEQRATNMRLIEQGAKLSVYYEKESEALLQASAQYDTAASRLRAFYKAKGELIGLFNADVIEFDELTEKIDEYADKVVSAKGAWGDYWVELKNNVNDMDQMFVDVFDSFKDSLVDALVDGELNFDDFVDTIKRKLAELAVNTIVVNVIGNITGISTAYSGLTSILGSSSEAASSVSSLSSAGSLLSGASSLSSLSKLSSWFGTNSLARSAGYTYDSIAHSLGGSAMSNSSANALMSTTNVTLLGSTIAGGLAGYFAGTSLFDGEYVGTGSAIGGAGGSYLGAAYGSTILPGIGTVIGGILGGALGGTAGGGIASLFGDDEPRFGGYATSFSGKGMEDNVTAQGGFGLTFGISDKGTKNIKAEDYQDALDGLAAVSIALESFYGTELSDKVEAALGDQLGDFNDWGNGLSDSFNSIFTTIMNTAVAAEGDVKDGVAHLLKVAVGDLGGSTEEMAQQIADGIDIVNATLATFDTAVGKLLGMSEEGAYGSMEESINKWKDLLSQFSAVDETAADALNRITTNIVSLSDAATIAGDSIEDMALSADWLVWVSANLADAINATGLSAEDFDTLESNAYNYLYSDKERAQNTLDTALAAIADWNEEMGHTGDQIVDTKEELKAYIKGLDLSNAAHHDAYINAILVSSSFISMDDALETLNGTVEDSIATIGDFIESITPEGVSGAADLKEMISLFDTWGMTLPATSDALYDLIQAGAFTDEQIEILTQYSDELQGAWSYLETLQSDLIDSLIDNLTDAYNAAVDAANDKSEAYIDQITEESDKYLEQLEEEYNDLVDSLNDQIDDLNDSLSTFEDILDSVASSLESLLVQTEGPDETRQRYLKMARDAIEAIKNGGEIPDNISDIISNLGSVNQDDFATYEEWLAAVNENADVLSELEDLANGQKTGIEKQIELLEAQLEQEKELYEAAVDAEEARLDALIEAEDKRLEKELDALEKEFNANKATIEDSTSQLIADLLTQTGLLDSIDIGISNVTDVLIDLLTDLIDVGGDGAPPKETDEELIDRMVELVNSMDDKTKNSVWQDIMDMVSNDGDKGLPMPDLGFTSDYDKLTKLLSLWETEGLFDKWDKTLIRKLLADYGIEIPGFAAGGRHSGGLRLVGERGPEIEATGSSAILNSADTVDFFKALAGIQELSRTADAASSSVSLTRAEMERTLESAGDTSELVEEVRQLREELKAANESLAKTSSQTTAMLNKWEQVGMPQMRNDMYDTPYKVEVV